MGNLADIQQAFVRRYMDDGGMVGVRVRELDGQIVLYVEVDDPKAVDLPSTFRDVPVVVRPGYRAVLAYA